MKWLVAFKLATYAMGASTLLQAHQAEGTGLATPSGKSPNQLGATTDRRTTGSSHERSSGSN